MWLEAGRTTEHVSLAFAEGEAPLDLPEPCRDADLPHLRDLIEHLPLTLIAKCRLVQRLGAEDRDDQPLERLNMLWRCHTELRDGAGLAPEMDALIACALAYRSVVVGRGGGADPASSAAVWRAASAGAALTDQARTWVADAILAERASPTPAATSDRSAQQWMLAFYATFPLVAQA